MGFGKIIYIDIGAANGISDEWTPFRDQLEIILFEPDDRSFMKLKQKDAKVYNCALGSEKGNRDLHLARKPEVSSFYRPNLDYLELFPNKERWDIIETVSVKTERLDELIDPEEYVDLIKLDTQGSELEILQGAMNTLETVLGLVVEVEFLEVYKKQPLFGDVCSFLSDRDFEFYDFLTEYRYGRIELDRKGQLAFADALFLRTPEYVRENFSLNRVYNYVQIAAIYGKYDLIKVMKKYVVDAAFNNYCDGLLIGPIP